MPKKRITKTSIRKKIGYLFFSLVVLGGLIWLTSDYRNYVLNKKFHIIIIKNRIVNNILEARRYEKNCFLFFSIEDLRQAGTYAGLAEVALVQIIKEYSDYTSSSAAELSECLKKLNQYQKALDISKKYIKENDLSSKKEIMAEIAIHQEAIRNYGRDVTMHVEEMVRKESMNIRKIIRQSRLILFAGTIAALVICLIVAVFLVFNVNRPLKRIAESVLKIAKGDYSKIPPLNTHDEFELLVDSLNSMIYELNKRGEQLIQNEKMASLGTLTAGVAHELNNPINNISTSLQILMEELETGDPEFQRTLLEKAEQQVERSQEIIRSLLEFSRESGFKPETVRFSRLVRKTVNLIKSELSGNIELAIDVPEDMEAVVDVQRIQQVLINLIVNAIQAMPEGGRLTISACCVPEKNQICFSVQDTGEGISDQAVKNIFDPFFTTKEVGQGSGLGLSVSYGIIERHGGHITVDSKKGEGTTFNVFLPLKKQEIEQP